MPGGRRDFDSRKDVPTGGRKGMHQIEDRGIGLLKPDRRVDEHREEAHERNHHHLGLQTEAEPNKEKRGKCNFRHKAGYKTAADTSSRRHMKISLANWAVSIHDRPSQSFDLKSRAS